MKAEEIKVKLKTVIETIKKEFPPYGFAVMIFPFNTPGSPTNFITNAKRAEIINHMKQLIKKFESEDDEKSKNG